MKPEHPPAAERDQRHASGQAAEHAMDRQAGDQGGMGAMGQMDPEQMHQQNHQQYLWVWVTAILLGFWLLASPVTLGYQNPSLVGERVLQVTADRGLPAVEWRATAMTWSDLISGALLVVLGTLALSPRRVLAQWAVGMVGVWLLFAPLLLWAPTAAMYTNDSLVGMLVIALAILIPGMPGMMLIMQQGPEVPPGWSYNPSSWIQRAPVIALGFVGLFGSRYLAAYQLGYIDTAWDPFFGDGTMRILDSDVSKAFPISDAGLGATVYALEALMGFMGGTARWRTMPWMVLLFGILVVPLGIVSIALVIMQPVMVGTWCTICLLTALAMLVMIPLTLDEVVAMAQFVARRVREGASFWRVFWFGDTVEGGGPDERSPRLNDPLPRTAPASAWGVTIPWNLLLTAALGLWLMAAPDVLGTRKPAADSDHLVGALVVTVAVLAMAEVTRAARFLNVLAGVWIVAAPWLLGGAPALATWNNVLVGVLVLLLSVPRGPVRERYGNWNRWVVWPARPASGEVEPPPAA